MGIQPLQIWETRPNTRAGCIGELAVVWCGRGAKFCASIWTSALEGTDDRVAAAGGTFAVRVSGRRR
jgi:hypothetical protein